MKNKIIAIVVLLFISAFFPVSIFAGQVTLDHVDGAWDNGGQLMIIPNCGEVAFYLRVNNDSPNNVTGLTNGFRIYGPSSFLPVTGEFYLDQDWHIFFDLVVGTSTFSSDGSGADTIGFSASRFMGTGLPPGYNEIAFVVRTGNITEGETLCLDSTFFPPSGLWIWAYNVGGSNSPSWDGPHCFQAMTCPCGWPEFTNCVDTLFLSTENQATYDFTQAFEGNFFYSVVNGPGSINSQNGEWTYTPQPSDAGTYQTLDLMLNGLCMQDYCSVVLSFDNCNPIIDLNGDCMSDIGDLVFMVEYMFNGGPLPSDFDLADADGNGTLDVADLVYIVNFMFGGGPPPVD